jgi:hypothetical protein
MIKLRELVGREAKWVQPSAMKHEFELHAGDAVAATLRFRSSFGTFATAESADGTWTFKRMGFWQTRASVRVAGADTDLAVFHNNTWRHGGTLETPDGRHLTANTNFWETEFEFRDESGTPLVSYRNITGVLHLSSHVEVHAAAGELAALPWLVPLGWYLALLMRSDSAAAASAAT